MGLEGEGSGGRGGEKWGEGRGGSGSKGEGSGDWVPPVHPLLDKRFKYYILCISLQKHVMGTSLAEP